MCIIRTRIRHGRIRTTIPISRPSNGHFRPFHDRTIPNDQFTFFYKFRHYFTPIPGHFRQFLEHSRPFRHHISRPFPDHTRSFDAISQPLPLLRSVQLPDLHVDSLQTTQGRYNRGPLGHQKTHSHVPDHSRAVQQGPTGTKRRKSQTAGRLQTISHTQTTHGRYNRGTQAQNTGKSHRQRPHTHTHTHLRATITDNTATSCQPDVIPESF